MELITINAFSSAVACLHNVTSSKIGCDAICYGVKTSRHMVSILQFVELVAKTEEFCFIFMLVYNLNTITLVT